MSESCVLVKLCAFISLWSFTKFVYAKLLQLIKEHDFVMRLAMHIWIFRLLE
jgi:hypothetical protein